MSLDKIEDLLIAEGLPVGHKSFLVVVSHGQAKPFEFNSVKSPFSECDQYPAYDVSDLEIEDGDCYYIWSDEVRKRMTPVPRLLSEVKKDA